MARTSVSRRLVYVKKTRNPVAPLPQQRAQPEEKTSTATFAAVPRPVVRPAGSGKLLKSAAIFVGLVCVGAVVAMMGRARTPSAADYAAAEARMAATAPAHAAISAFDDYQSVGLPSILSQRSAPTDESFRAAGYARRR